MSRLHRSPRQPHLPVAASRRRAAAPWLAALAVLLAGCGGVQVKPMPELPRALVVPMQARVGLVLDEELRRFDHEETRGNSNWKVELGPGHEELFRGILAASFGSVEVFQNTAGARGASGIQTLFHPQIEQFSFATDDETGGQYWAVTIRYRIGILGKDGEAIDALTLTGYGSARGGRAASALTRATRSAMRDAASKFLVQMPRQPLVQKLVAGQVLTAADAAAALVDVVETVPIEPESATAP
jgi:hypothetical protein